MTSHRKPLPAADLEIYLGLRRVGAIRTGSSGAWAVTRDGTKLGPFGTAAEAKAALLEAPRP